MSIPPEQGHGLATFASQTLIFDPRNMFLAAAPYFQKRFAEDQWILEHFQSAIISVSTCTNLLAMLVLTNIQYTANYPLRINAALVLSFVVFNLLTGSTSFFLDVSPGAYLAFLLVMVSLSAYACWLLQNGAFAFAASFGRPEYTQAIMAGQGVAGVLPPLTEVLTVLIVSPADDVPSPSPQAPGKVVPSPPSPTREIGGAAFLYFFTAVLVSVAAFAAFQPLVRRHTRLVENRMVETMAESMTSVEEAERAARKVVTLQTLFRKLHWPALAVFMCYLVSMFFPVFTAKIVSVTPPERAGRLLSPAAFIPLAFFFWNLGDLLGKLSTILPFTLSHRPALLFAVSIARWLFLPLYLLCNVGGGGAVVNSDFFYLILVQLPFGLTNGWLGSSSMMAAGEWVDEGEREVAGGFMGLCLVAGLTAGSLLSFTAGGI